MRYVTAALTTLVVVAGSSSAWACGATVSAPTLEVTLNQFVSDQARSPLGSFSISNLDPSVADVLIQFVDVGSPTPQILGVPQAILIDGENRLVGASAPPFAANAYHVAQANGGAARFTALLQVDAGGQAVLANVGSESAELRLACFTAEGSQVGSTQIITAPLRLVVPSRLQASLAGGASSQTLGLGVLSTAGPTVGALNISVRATGRYAVSVAPANNATLTLQGFASPGASETIPYSLSFAGRSVAEGAPIACSPPLSGAFAPGASLPLQVTAGSAAGKRGGAYAGQISVTISPLGLDSSSGPTCPAS